MTPSQIKQQQDNLLRLSQLYTQQDLDEVMKQHPEITCNGIESRRSNNYESNRVYLRNSLKAFQLCCAFLSLCKRSKRASWDFTNNNYLKHRVEHFMHTPIPSGAIVASAEVVGININQIQKILVTSAYV